MNRKIQQRCDWGDIKSEWEDHPVYGADKWSDSDVKAWVREANKRAKREGSYERYRSIADESGNNW